LQRMDGQRAPPFFTWFVVIHAHTRIQATNPEVKGPWLGTPFWPQAETAGVPTNASADHRRYRSACMNDVTMVGVGFQKCRGRRRCGFGISPGRRGGAPRAVDRWSTISPDSFMPVGAAKVRRIWWVLSLVSQGSSWRVCANRKACSHDRFQPPRLPISAFSKGRGCVAYGRIACFSSRELRVFLVPGREQDGQVSLRAGLISAIRA